MRSLPADHYGAARGLRWLTAHSLFIKNLLNLTPAAIVICTFFARLVGADSGATDNPHGLWRASSAVRNFVILRFLA